MHFLGSSLLKDMSAGRFGAVEISARWHYLLSSLQKKKEKKKKKKKKKKKRTKKKKKRTENEILLIFREHALRGLRPFVEISLWE